MTTNFSRRVAVNAVRISDGADPVVADVPLKLAAYRLAKDLVRACVRIGCLDGFALQGLCRIF